MLIIDPFQVMGLPCRPHFFGTEKVPNVMVMMDRKGTYLGKTDSLGS